MNYDKEMRQGLIINGRDAQARFIEHGWTTGFDYKADNCFMVEDKPFPLEILRNEKFRKTLRYAKRLYWMDDQFKSLSNQVVEEHERWIRNGICSYVSIVLYHLLLKAQLCNRGTLEYVQGYTLHNDERINKVYHTTHAWLIVKNSPLDLTIYQLRNHGYTFGKEIFTVGKPPDNVLMVGYVETEKTIQYLTKKFAKAANMGSNDWIDFHINNTNKFAKISS